MNNISNLVSSCVICNELDTDLVWRGENCQIIFPNNASFATLRIIWLEHIREFSQLTNIQRYYLSDILAVVESFLLDSLNPDKINLASLGNVVPHLHWHVIPRWQDDEFFPDSIWSATKRPSIVRNYPDSREIWKSKASNFFANSLVNY